MSRYIDLTEFAERIKKHIKPNNHEEKALIEWCKDECIRQAYAMPWGDVVEVRHGEWKEDNRLRRSAKFRCSVCDGLAYFVQPTRDETWEKCCPYKYCPNCGARMDGERRAE